MLSIVHSASTVGLEGVLIRVEVDVYQRGFPTFTIVGLPNKAIDESKERVRTAIKNAGFTMPEAKIVVNLAPADIPKEGSSFDLPVALGILAASGTIDKEALKELVCIGELSLNGSIQPVSGILPITMLAQKKHFRSIYVPQHNGKEAAVIKGIAVYPVAHMQELVLHLNNQKMLKKAPYISLFQRTKEVEAENDFADIKGQQKAKRALAIAAAGGHNLHMKGPPGAGKTMLARALPSILPTMDEEEMLEVSKIYSVTSGYKAREFMVERPFRHPHHTVSLIGMIGGGSKISPGEVSLAHRGVLFMDEFAEFPRSVLESLRQPIEDGIITITRVSGSVQFPARFMLICASNPCPCGYLGHPTKRCVCTQTQIAKYRKRLSGPILDRIDIHLDVTPVRTEHLLDQQPSLSSKAIRAIVEKARQRQAKRFSQEKIKVNAEMKPVHIKKYCVISEDGQEVLTKAVTKLSLSARAYFKVIKTAQTIADMFGDEQIEKKHILEALQYRVDKSMDLL